MSHEAVLIRLGLRIDVEGEAAGAAGTCGDDFVVLFVEDVVPSAAAFQDEPN